MPIEIIYEVHATTVDNETGRATGWLDGELSERGRAEARDLGARRRGDGLDAIFTSDLRRAVETVEIAFAGTSIPVHRDPRLRECDYGEWTGGPAGRIGPDRVRRIHEPFPGGESYTQATDRMAAFLTELVQTSYRRVLVVGHSATRWALEHLVNGTPLEELVTAPYRWQEGWTYRLPDGWRRD